MLQTALLTACLVACAAQPPADEPTPPTEAETVQPSRAEHYVTLLNWPYDNILYQDGLRWIQQHPDEAHPVLVARLDERGTGHHHIPRVLAMLGRPEGVPPLKRALRGDSEVLAGAAGVALGGHPHELALAALLGALQPDTNRQAMYAAINGLWQRGDPAACPALAGLLHHEDSNIRYYVLRTCAALGCLEPTEIASFTEDPDPDVAALARGLVGSGQGSERPGPGGGEGE